MSGPGRRDPRATRAFPPTRRRKARRKIVRLLVWLGVFGAFFLLVSLFQDEIVALIRKSPFLWSIYTHVSEQVEGATLLGLFYGGLIGALFFVVLPLEPLYFYFLSLDYQPAWVILVMLISSTLGLFVDYLIGASVGGTILSRFAPERYEKVNASMERWGGGIVFFSNIILFLPIQLISVAIGSTRFGARRFFVWTLFARLVYLLMLYYALDFLTTHVFP